MAYVGHCSLPRVCQQTGAYPQLVLSLCDYYRIPTVRVGRRTFIADEHVSEVGWRVHEWKRRPRLSRARLRVPVRVVQPA